MTDAELDYLGVERWAPCPDAAGCSVSTYGRVRGASGRILKPVPHHNGYLRVRLWCSETKRKPTWRLHRLVATVFIPNPDELPEVHHIDHDIKNNVFWNLEWVNRQTNIDYRYSPDREPATQSPSAYY